MIDFIHSRSAAYQRGLPNARLSADVTSAMAQFDVSKAAAMVALDLDESTLARILTGEHPVAADYRRLLAFARAQN